jgi:hypothetical protein
MRYADAGCAQSGLSSTAGDEMSETKTEDTKIASLVGGTRLRTRLTGVA